MPALNRSWGTRRRVEQVYIAGRVANRKLRDVVRTRRSAANGTAWDILKIALLLCEHKNWRNGRKQFCVFYHGDVPSRKMSRLEARLFLAWNRRSAQAEATWYFEYMMGRLHLSRTIINLPQKKTDKKSHTP